MAFVDTISQIDLKLEVIKSNTQNSYILKEVNIIDIKMNEIKDKKYTTQEVVDSVCDNIINTDLDNISRVGGESELVYVAVDELKVLVEKIKTEYFEDAE